MSGAREPVIGITLGDPGGIGPEVTVKALAGLRGGMSNPLVIYAPRELAERAASRWITPGEGSVLWRGDIEYRGESIPFVPSPSPSAQGGAYSFRAVEAGIQDAMRAPGDARRIDALVTGPISKEAWAMSGHAEFPGHTELLAARCGVAHPVMSFFGRELRVALVTAHVPLARVSAMLTVDGILGTIVAGARGCAALGMDSARVAVCGLNPHAGESGLLGSEDHAVIRPAIEAARAMGIDATGPWPADTVFISARQGKHDLVVAMYHDQGLIPVKLLERDEAVNVTLGLPIVRTSPDHGTAFDIAGQGVADAGSMKAAIRMAVRLAESTASSRAFVSRPAL